MLKFTLALILALSAVSQALLAVFIRRRYASPLAGPYALTLLTMAGWTVSYGCSLLTDDLATKVFFRQITFVILPFVPVAWYLCIHRYTSPERRPPPDLPWWLIVVPCVTAVLSITSSHHRLMEYDHRLEAWGPLFGAGYQLGAWAKGSTLFLSFVLAASAVRLLLFLRHASGAFFFRRTLLLVVLTFIPSLSTFLFYFAFNPIPGYSITPFVMGPIALGHWYALFHYNVFELLPIAQQLVFAHLSEGLLVFNRDGRLVDFNVAAGGMIGIAQPADIGKTAEALLREGSIMRFLRSEEEAPCLVPALGDETRRTWELSRRRVFSPNGSEEGFYLLIRDVTDRMRAEQEIRENEIRYRRLIEEAPFPALINDLEQDLIHLANPSVAQWVGIPLEQIVGGPVSCFYQDPEVRRTLLDLLRASGRFSNREVILKRGAHGPATVLLSAAVIEWRGRRSIFATFMDITESRRVQAELAASELRKHQLAIAENEKQRIGRDLHDAFGQRLTGCALLCHTLERKLEAAGRPEWKDAGTVRQLLNQAVEDARMISHGLNPADLAGTGFWCALEETVEQIRRLNTIEITLTPRHPLGIDSGEVAIHLLRIAQEAIANALRHGSPKRIGVTLSIGKEEGNLEIIDDGSGFDPQRLPAPSASGLQIMRYRAEFIGGTLSIRSASGSGTTVACAFPLSFHRFPDPVGQFAQGKRLGQKENALFDNPVVGDDPAGMPGHEDDTDPGPKLGSP